MLQYTFFTCPGGSAGLVKIPPGQNKNMATNTIAPDDWPEKSCRFQEESPAKEIFRVMIRRRNEPDFNKQLDELAMRQLRECGVEAVSHYLKEDLYEHFKSEIAELG